MQQEKENAPCTAATAQDANEHLESAHTENITEEVKKQVLALTNDLDFADVELGEIHLVLQDVLQQIYEEVEPVHNVHSEFSQARFTYYGAVLRMICRSLFDLKTDIAGITEAAEKLNDEVNG